MTATAVEIARYLDTVLNAPSTPDHPNALNGLQVDSRRPVARVTAAVDFSLRAVEETARRGANLLIVHHGVFWGGLRPLMGHNYDRMRALLDNDIAVYGSHLPLDAHPSLGNGVLLARELGLEPTLPFAQFHGIAVGVAGDSDVDTRTLFERADAFARTYGGIARASAFAESRRTRRWALCTGAGANADTLREARALGADTLIVGEGPHHTAVEAPEFGLVIMYAGHYATETLGVKAAAELVSREFGIPWEFVFSPTGTGL